LWRNRRKAWMLLNAFQNIIFFWFQNLIFFWWRKAAGNGLLISSWTFLHPSRFGVSCLAPPLLYLIRDSFLREVKTICLSIETCVCVRDCTCLRACVCLKERERTIWFDYCISKFFCKEKTKCHKLLSARGMFMRFKKNPFGLGINVKSFVVSSLVVIKMKFVLIVWNRLLLKPSWRGKDRKKRQCLLNFGRKIVLPKLLEKRKKPNNKLREIGEKILSFLILKCKLFSFSLLLHHKFIIKMNWWQTPRGPSFSLRTGIPDLPFFE